MTQGPNRTARRATTALLAAGVLLGAGPAIHAAHAQQIGNRPYSFPARSGDMAAQAQLARRTASNPVVNQSYSLSTAIGNMTQITQSVGAGASAGLTLNNTQTSSGSQSSGASLNSTADLSSLLQPSR